MQTVQLVFFSFTFIAPYMCPNIWCDVFRKKIGIQTHPILNLNCYNLDLLWPNGYFFLFFLINIGISIFLVRFHFFSIFLVRFHFFLSVSIFLSVYTTPNLIPFFFCPFTQNLILIPFYFFFFSYFILINVGFSRPWERTWRLLFLLLYRLSQ